MNNNHAGYENGELDENELNENGLVDDEENMDQEEDFFNENNRNNHHRTNGRNGNQPPAHYDQNEDDVQDVEDYDDDGGGGGGGGEEDDEEDDDENGYFANGSHRPHLNQLNQSKLATIPLINPDNHYERQYACKQCDFVTNNPRAVLYHRKEFHKEKINVHECSYCQYASQYSGKVERHTMLRHKAEMALKQSANFNAHNMLKQRSDNKNDENHHHHTNHHHHHAESVTNANGGLNLPAKFQCNQCPCKYKRSSDLSKHLRLKHALNLNMNVKNAVGQQQNWVFLWF